MDAGRRLPARDWSAASYFAIISWKTGDRSALRSVSTTRRHQLRIMSFDSALGIVLKRKASLRESIDDGADSSAAPSRVTGRHAHGGTTGLVRERSKSHQRASLVVPPIPVSLLCPASDAFVMSTTTLPVANARLFANAPRYRS